MQYSRRNQVWSISKSCRSSCLDFATKVFCTFIFSLLAIDCCIYFFQFRNDATKLSLAVIFLLAHYSSCMHNAVYDVRIKWTAVDWLHLAKTEGGYCQSAGGSALVQVPAGRYKY